MPGPDQRVENPFGVRQIGGVIRFWNAPKGCPDQINGGLCALAMRDEAGAAERELQTSIASPSASLEPRCFACVFLRCEPPHFGRARVRAGGAAFVHM
jgi:hypothetical protein